MRASIIRVSAILFVFCLGLGLFFQTITVGQEKSLKEQMQKKMDSMGEVLTGLALEDWARVEKGAQGLIDTCVALGWTGPGKEEFGRRDEAFHASAQKLLKHAKKKI